MILSLYGEKFCRPRSIIHGVYGQLTESCGKMGSLEDNFTQMKTSIFVVKTNSHDHSLALAKECATNLGAITCSCYSTDAAFMEQVEEEMNAAFTPVSFNFGGAAFVNQHAAFSDFHVTGGNPSGNASFTDAQYVNRRFVWVGNRRMS